MYSDQPPTAFVTTISSSERTRLRPSPYYIRHPLKLCSRASTTTHLHLWRPWAATAATPSRTVSTTVASTPTTQLIVSAFVLGGIFFSFIVPRIISWTVNILGTAALQYQQQRQQRQNNDKKEAHQKSKKKNERKRRRRNWLRRLPSFQTVKKNELILLQHVTNNLINRSFQTQLHNGLNGVLENAFGDIETKERNDGNNGGNKINNKNNPDPTNTIRKIELVSFQTTSAPVFLKGRIYNTNNNDNNSNSNNDDNTSSTLMAFEVDWVWKNAVSIELVVTTQRLGLVIPIIINNVNFKGRARIVLTPLTSTPPGFGAILFSLTRPPKNLNLQVTVAGRNITKIRWLKAAILGALRGIIQQQLVWPNRIVNAALRPNFNETVVERDILQKLETEDPFGRFPKQKEEPKTNDRDTTTTTHGGFLSWIRKQQQQRLKHKKQEVVSQRQPSKPVNKPKKNRLNSLVKRWKFLQRFSRPQQKKTSNIKKKKSNLGQLLGSVAQRLEGDNDNTTSESGGTSIVDTTTATTGDTAIPLQTNESDGTKLTSSMDYGTVAATNTSSSTVHGSDVDDAAAKNSLASSTNNNNATSASIDDLLQNANSMDELLDLLGET